MKKKRYDALHYIKIAIAVLVTAMVISLAFLGYRLGRLVFTEDAVSAEADAFSWELNIKKGEGTLAIGLKLEQAGIIESGIAFAVQAKVFDATIEAGDYVVSSDMSSREIVKMLNAEYVKAHTE